MQTNKNHTHPVRGALLLSFVQLFHAFVLDVRRLDTRSLTSHFMWMQQVSSGLLPLPSIHLKSLWHKTEMLLFHRKGCPRWVSVQLQMGSWDVTYYFSCRLLRVWCLLSRSWEGVRSTSVINNYRKFCPAFAARRGLGCAPSGAQGRAAQGGCHKHPACVTCR